MADYFSVTRKYEVGIASNHRL